MHVACHVDGAITRKVTGFTAMQEHMVRLSGNAAHGKACWLCINNA